MYIGHIACWRFKHGYQCNNIWFVLINTTEPEAQLSQKRPCLPGTPSVPHGSSVGVEVVAVLEHVGHSVGGAQVGHGGGVAQVGHGGGVAQVGHGGGGAHVTGGGQVHSSHSTQQLSQAGGSGHVGCS